MSAASDRVARTRPLSRAEAAAELLRRRRAQNDLREYARSVVIPGAPARDELDFDEYLEETIFKPVDQAIARHHDVMLSAIQRCMETPSGRLMILAPPGSAKSTYVDVVGPAWAMGKWPGLKIIMTSYATRIARKHSRRAMQLTRSSEHRSIWPSRPEVPRDRASAEDWATTDGSEYMAAGILAGITGNRANGAICDDLIAGRQEADSETTRETTWEAYQDDLGTRLLPGAWIIMINTRWHVDDVCGRILPEDYDGRSGYVKCRDGQTWYVLNMPAKAELPDDPVGREIGEYLWPEYFPASHWQLYENNPAGRRTWESLYQQRPTESGNEDFKREWFHWYDEASDRYVCPCGRRHTVPERFRFYGASDFAVKDPTKGKKEKQQKERLPDFTEQTVVGMDEVGNLWFRDWWTGRKTPDVYIAAMIDMVRTYRPLEWWDEQGVIDHAIRPAVERAMRDEQTFTVFEALPGAGQDKRANCQSFRARAAAGTVYLPRGKEWAIDMVDQLVRFPAIKYDDKYDVCGLIGRGIEKMINAEKAPPAAPLPIKPFTAKWLEYEESTEQKKPRIR